MYTFTTRVPLVSYSFIVFINLSPESSNPVELNLSWMTGENTLAVCTTLLTRTRNTYINDSILNYRIRIWIWYVHFSPWLVWNLLAMLASSLLAFASYQGAAKFTFLFDRWSQLSINVGMDRYESYNEYRF